MPRRKLYDIFPNVGNRRFFIFRKDTSKQRNLRIGTGENGVFGIFGYRGALIVDPKKGVKFSRRKK